MGKERFFPQSTIGKYKKWFFCWQQTVFGTKLFPPDSEFYHEDRGGLGRELRMVLKAAEAVR